MFIGNMQYSRNRTVVCILSLSQIVVVFLCIDILMPLKRLIIGLKLGLRGLTDFQAVTWFLNGRFRKHLSSFRGLLTSLDLSKNVCSKNILLVSLETLWGTFETVTDFSFSDFSRYFCARY